MRAMEELGNIAWGLLTVSVLVALYALRQHLAWAVLALAVLLGLRSVGLLVRSTVAPWLERARAVRRPLPRKEAYEQA